MGVIFFWILIVLTVFPLIFRKFTADTTLGRFFEKHGSIAAIVSSFVPLSTRERLAESRIGSLLIFKVFLIESWWPVLRTIGQQLNIVGMVVCLYFFMYLPWATNHGQIIKVPNIQEMKLSEAESALNAKKLNLVVSDTKWDPNEKPSTVIRQNPSPDSEVKEGRKVYVIMNNSSAPKIKITEDIYSRISEGYKHNVLEVLSSLDFKTNTYYRPHRYRDYVIGVEYRARKVRIGDQIPQGSEIDVYLGDGSIEDVEEDILETIMQETQEDQGVEIDSKEVTPADTLP